MPLPKLVFVNRRFVPEREAAFSVFDRGLLYGDGLFETVRIYSGRFFRLGAHIKRLYEGLKILGIKIPYSRDELEIFTRELAITNRIQDGFSRIVVSRGEGLLGFSPHGCLTPHVAICARERQGLSIRSAQIWKLMISKNPVTPIPLKSLSYLPHVLAKKEAEDAKCHDAILTNHAGEVIEATGSNLFLIHNDEILTPPLSVRCLPGITRAEVIKVIRKEGHRVIEKRIKVADCRKASAIFLTNSLLEIVPATLGRPPSRDILARIDEIEAAFAYHRSTHVR